MAAAPFIRSNPFDDYRARPNDRFLIDPDGPDAEWFEIRNDAARVTAFYTGGVNGKSAEDTAIGNLIDASEYTDGALHLYRGPLLPSWSNGIVLIASAEHGIGRFPEVSR